jgi:hypothetical protein
MAILNPVKSQNDSKQKEQCKKYYNTRFQIILRVIVINREWYHHQNIHVDQ